ncbi:MAG: hypothetical protein LIO92_09630 [Clostridiales bacterium]|nr:hypothetical protein [Clostridiales bacterium]
MKQKILCLAAACVMLVTACTNATSSISSVSSAATEQASGAADATTEAETQSCQTEAAPSSDVIYLKETATHYDKDGNLIKTTTYSYNEHNDISEYVTAFPDDDAVRYYYEYDYREDGTISSCRWYNSKDQIRSETFYAEDGETIDHIVRNTYSSQHEDDSDENAEDWLRAQTILNADEVPVSKTTFLEDGSVRRKEEHEYNEYGDIIHVVNTRYEEGESLIFSDHTYEYEYNTDGTFAKTSAVLKLNNAPDSVLTDEYTYQDGYLYKEYSSGTTLYDEYSNGAIEDYSWWEETVYNEEGFPVSWSSDNMEEDEQEYYEGEDLSGLVTYHSDGTVDILPEDGFIATCDEYDIVFVRIGSDQDIAGEPEEELDENGNVAARTYYCHSGEVNKRVEYTYIVAEN